MNRDKITTFTIMEKYKDFSEIPENTMIGTLMDNANGISLTFQANSTIHAPEMEALAVYFYEQESLIYGDTMPKKVFTTEDFGTLLPPLIKPSDLTEGKTAEILNYVADSIIKAREGLAEQMAYEKKRDTFMDAAYELYKEDWIQEHISNEARLTALRNSLTDYLSDKPDCSFWEYHENALKDSGFGGILYASKAEFLDTEFLDFDYMHELLKDDALIEEYDEIRAKEIEESEPLYSSEEPER